jgi:hypothetical protein
VAFGIDHIGKEILKGSYHNRRRRRNAGGSYHAQAQVTARKEHAAQEAKTNGSPYHAQAQVRQRNRLAGQRRAHSLLRGSRSLLLENEPPEVAGLFAAGGVRPPPHLLKTNPAAYRAAEGIRLSTLPSDNLVEPEDLTNAILLASGAGDLFKLAKGGAEVGAEALGATAAKQAASSAETKTLADALKAIPGKAIAKRAGARTAIRGTTRRAAQKIEPEAFRGARTAISRRATQTAEKLPTPLRVGGKVAGKAASLPVRHPLTAPIGLQAPVALFKGDPKALLEPLEGKGVEASIAGAAGHLAPIAGEAVSLPASVLPTAYLVGKAGTSALQGNSKELDELKAQYLKTGFLPALAAGNPSEALKRLGEHPLYSALEASGAAAVAGRGAGALLREASGGHLAGTERAPLPIEGTPLNIQRRYSRDAFRQIAQRGFDRTRAGRRIRPDTFRGRHYLKEAANRFESGEEAIRKAHIHEDMKALRKTLPKKWGRIDRKSAEVVNLAVERIIRHPETFSGDLPKYREMLEVAAKQLGPDGKPVLDRYQMTNNKALLKQIKAAESMGPERIHGTVHAANQFIALQHPILQEMIDLKLIDPQQAAKASAISFGRVHMGAGYKDGIGVVDRHGKPLSLEDITAEMQRQGIEPPGFLSHRAPTAGDFYQSNVGGAMLEKGARTGESVATGSQVGGIEALVRQLRRSRGLVDRAKAWNKAVTRFGIEVKGVETWADAKRVLKDPQRYGLDPRTQPVAVPRHPFAAKKNEVMGALEHQSPDIAGESASEIVAGALSDALKGKPLNDKTPVVFFPAKVAEQLREGATPAGGGLRGFQAGTTLFTRTVLPFSPGWYIGNSVDNALRTAFAGINPAHFLLGSKVKRELSPEAQAELLAGAHYSSQAALNPHRSIESVVRGYDPLSKGIRQATEWSHHHGWKQAVVKLGPKLLGKSSDYLIAVNSFLTEDLPQRGALGKLALAEMKDTQGSWLKALVHQKEIAKDFANKAVNPDKMIRFQKDLELVYGNYTRMSPAARKFLRNISPFWTWFRAAYKFVYLTMPAHRPIATAALTAGSRATQPTREEYGLDKEGEKPLPPFMQGGIPLPGGGIFPTSSYTSFGYASNPVEALSKLPFPQFQGVVEALRGRDWKGEPLEGGDSNKILTALWTLGTGFIPGAPLIAEDSEGKRSLVPHIPNLPHSYDKGYVNYKRTPTQQITVPASGSSSGSSSSAPWKSSSSSSGTAPWKTSSSSSSGTAPWK